jgi:hypothetical protein
LLEIFEEAQLLRIVRCTPGPESTTRVSTLSLFGDALRAIGNDLPRFEAISRLGLVAVAEHSRTRAEAKKFWKVLVRAVPGCARLALSTFSREAPGRHTGDGLDKTALDFDRAPDSVYNAPKLDNAAAAGALDERP